MKKRILSRADAGARVAERLRHYPPLQHAACAAAGAPFSAPDYSRIALLGPGIAEGYPLVLGVRYPESDEMSGWAFTAEDRPRPALTSLRFEPLRNLVLIRPDLVPYVALPEGWSFSLYGDGSWYAHSPKDQLVDWITNLLVNGEDSADDARAIGALVDGHFAGTELYRRLRPAIQAWTSGPSTDPSGMRSTMEWARRWLEDSGGR